MAERWSVSYDHALAEWQARGPHDPDLLVAVLEWVFDCIHEGPPIDAMQALAADELYVAVVQGLKIAYLAINQDKRLIVKSIT